MKKITVDKLQNGDIKEFFAVVMAERRTTKTNKPFMRLFLADSTGEVPGVAWDNVDKLEKILVPGAIVNVTATVNQYDNSPQLNVKNARPVTADDKIDISDFKPSTPHDITHLYRQVLDLINAVSNPFIKTLLENLFENDEFSDKFCQHTAAKRVHHAYAGGLIEHTLMVAKNSLAMAQQYPFVNRDILIAGSLLHDIGKMQEMSGDLTTEYTLQGSLIGHLQIGSEIISQEVAKIADFPEKLKWELQHLILSHHGRLEYGSPVLPTTIEAVILHTADMLDAQIFQVVAAIEDVNDPDAEFTKRIFGLDRKMMVQPLAATENDQQAPLSNNVEELLNKSIIDNNPLQETLL